MYGFTQQVSPERVYLLTSRPSSRDHRGNAADQMCCRRRCRCGQEQPHKVLHHWFIPIAGVQHHQDWRLLWASSQSERKTVHLRIWNTAGNETYIERDRWLLYQNTDVFVICFSLVKRSTFANAREKWYQQISFYSRNALVILVGTKLDLRENQERGFLEAEDLLAIVGKDDGVEMMKDMAALTYVECSSVTTCGVERVFYKAAKAVLKLRKNQAKSHSTCIHCRRANSFQTRGAEQPIAGKTALYV